MKRTGISRPKFSNIPIDWRVAERAMLQTNAADTCDTRVSEENFDFDDKQAEAEIMAHCRNHGLN